MDLAGCPTTPPGELRASNQCEWLTPRKEDVRAVIAYTKWTGQEVRKSDVFTWAGVSKSTGWRCFKTTTPRQLAGDTTRTETQGRPSKIT